MNQSSSIIEYGCFHPDYAEEVEYFRQCKVYRVQIESTLVEEARVRTEKEGPADLITYRLGNGLDIPFKEGSFDVVW